jgi:hypothetical protein
MTPAHLLISSSWLAVIHPIPYFISAGLVNIEMTFNSLPLDLRGTIDKME